MIVPLHEKQSTHLDPQANSPLYNGRIPAEIRTAIFEYALAEYLIPGDNSKSLTLPTLPYVKNRDWVAQSQGQSSALANFRSSKAYSVNSHYTRPGYAGPKRINTALLRTCRRIYLEAYHLPPVTKEHVFWHARGPSNHRGSTLSHQGEQEHRYFDLMEPWQLSLVKEIHLFTQLFWLEDVFLRMASRDFMQGMESIKITIRRGDWWNWESNSPLGISPQNGHGRFEIMRTEWKRERSGGVTPWADYAWGSAFKRMKNLKMIKFELETSEDKLDDLKSIVEHAKNWKFPAFSAENGPEMVFAWDSMCKWSQWEGPPCYWSARCPHCGNGLKCVTIEPAKPGCLDRTKRRSEDIGPPCHIANLTWRLQQAGPR